jgi:RNA polymerase sigma-70 factor (ECF subfamily)
LEGSFISSSPERMTIWGSNPFSSDDKNKATSTASDMAGDWTSTGPRDGDMATLIGVVAEQTGPDRLSDAQLMSAVAEGDSCAFEKLYDRHVRSCYGLAVKVVQEPSLAEDVVQEVFIKIWSRPECFSAQRGNFNSWLLTLVRNKSLDKLREMKRTSAKHMLSTSTENATSDNPVNLVSDSSPTPHDQVWTRETGGVVRQALRQLPANEYQTITLAYFGGLSQQAIADKLQQPLGTVKTRTRSALRRLHNFLAAEGALSD